MDGYKIRLHGTIRLALNKRKGLYVSFVLVVSKVRQSLGIALILPCGFFSTYGALDNDIFLFLETSGMVYALPFGRSHSHIFQRITTNGCFLLQKFV